MTEKEYNQRMKNYRNIFEALWPLIVDDVMKFKSKTEYQTPNIDLDSEMHDTTFFINDLALSAAWIKDTLENKSGYIGHEAYEKSTTHRIRKALNYIL